MTKVQLPVQSRRLDAPQVRCPAWVTPLRLVFPSKFIVIEEASHRLPIRGRDIPIRPTRLETVNLWTRSHHCLTLVQVLVVFLCLEDILSRVKEGAGLVQEPFQLPHCPLLPHPSCSHRVVDLAPIVFLLNLSDLQSTSRI